MRRISGILLAAGLGRRFGSNKLLHPLGDGIPLVLHSVRTLQTVLPDTLVVVNAQDHGTIALLESEGLNMVLNHSAGAGMGTSIASGVRARQSAEGWVIAMADMPCLRQKTIRAVAAGLQNPSSICAPSYEGQRGHPVGFGCGYADALMELSADEGARHIISANWERLELFETSDQGVIIDIDHRKDLERSAVLEKAGDTSPA